MKRIKLTIFCILIAVAAIASACVKDNVDYLGEMQSTTTVKFIAAETDSRAAFDEPTDGTYPTLWLTGDKVAAWVNSKTRKIATVTPLADGKRASFSVELVDDNSGEYTIHILSPWGSETGSGLLFWNNSNGHRAVLPIPDVQTSSATSCDPKAQVIAAKTPTIQAASLAEAFAEPIEVKFSHLTAYGCLTLKNLPEKALKAVVLIAETPIAGRVNFRFQGQETSFVTRDDTKNTLVINTTRADKVWFGIYPNDMSGKKLTIGAVMIDDTYYAKTITFDKGGNFQAGRIAEFGVDFAGVESCGDLSVYRESGVATGIRYSTSKDSDGTDKIVSLTRCAATPWIVDANNSGATVVTGATDHGYDGATNWNTLTSWLSTNNDYSMPIYDFCTGLGEGWYWPNAYEMIYLSRDAYKPYVAQFEVMLAYNGGDLLNGYSSADGDAEGDRYWTSRELTQTSSGTDLTANAYYFRMDAGEENLNSSGAPKTKKYFGRAIKVVGDSSGTTNALPEAGERTDYAEAASIGISRPYYPIQVGYKSSKSGSWKYADTRILAYIDGYQKQISTPSDYLAITNKYGSYTGGARYTATGRFRIEKAGDRWWIIDPEGYPHYMRGLCTFIQGTSERNKEAFAKRFAKDTRNWVAASREELASIGFHSTGAFGKNGGYVAQEEYNAANGDKPFPRAPGFNFLTQFRQTYDKTYPGGSQDDAIGLVLEDEWEKFCEEYIGGEEFAPFINDINTMGFFSDNEINFSSMSTYVLQRFLTIEDTEERAYKYAQVFMVEKGYAGTLEAFTALSSTEKKSINSEFAGRLAEKYYGAIRRAKDKCAPNLLYLGSRLHGTPKYQEHVIEAAGKYCDIISINYYSRWSPEAEWMKKWAELAPNTPFFITEFYTQSLEGSDADATGVGAGYYVPTEKERGYAYQHFTLGLLECKHCVGWHWFRYQDTEEPSSFKGVYDNDYNLFPFLSGMMQEVNTNVYNLIEFFDNQATGK